MLLRIDLAALAAIVLASPILHAQQPRPTSERTVPAPYPFAPTPEPIRAAPGSVPASSLAALANQVIRQELDGQPVAMGPAYRANFTADGLLFTPRMGPDDASRTLRFAFESAKVGDVPVTGLDLRVDPALADGTVVFDRGAGVREIYEPLEAGLEQSFAFESLPSRSGDLVVRGRLETNLPLPADSGVTERIELREPSGRGAFLEKVVGVDARGVEVPGSMRIAGHELELRLPASFVAEAELPLVLDPLIGGFQDVAGSSIDYLYPDAAYGARGLTRYGVTWERRWSGTDVDVMFVELDEDLVQVGGQKILEGFIEPLSIAPAIAFNNQTNQFLVVWEHYATPASFSDVYARQVFASGALSSTIPVAQGSGRQFAPDVGSEATTLDNEVLVVWNDDGEIKGAQVAVDEGFTPFPFGPVTIESTTGLTVSRPRISESGGSSGRYLVTWTKSFGIDRDVGMRVVDRNQNLLGTSRYLSTIGPNESFHDVDGDGSTFLVAYERDPVLAAFDRDIYARRILVDGSGVVDLTLELTIDAPDGEDDRRPAVGFAGNRFYVAWEDPFSNPFFVDLAYVGLDPGATQVAEPKTFVTVDGNQNTYAAFAGRPAGGGANGRADFVFQRDSGVDVGENIEIQALGTEGGIVANLGGGCGGAGSISIDGDLLVGTPAYDVRLDGAPPEAAIAILNVNQIGQLSICGPCVVNPYQFLWVRSIDGGSAKKILSVPVGPQWNGLTFEYQWTVLFTGASPCPLAANVSFTDRLRGTITY